MLFYSSSDMGVGQIVRGKHFLKGFFVCVFSLARSIRSHFLVWHLLNFDSKQKKKEIECAFKLFAHRKELFLGLF